MRSARSRHPWPWPSTESAAAGSGGGGGRARRHLAAGLTAAPGSRGCGRGRDRAGACPAAAAHHHQGADRRGQSPRAGGGDPRPGARAPWASPFNPAQLSDDIRAIFALGFFDDVQAKVTDFEGGVRLTFVVKERPFVRDIAFAGQQGVQHGDPPGEDRRQAGQRVQPGGRPAVGGRPQDLLRGGRVPGGPDHPRDRALRGRRRQGDLQHRRGAPHHHQPHRHRGEQGAHRQADQGRR